MPATSACWKSSELPVLKGREFNSSPTLRRARRPSWAQLRAWWISRGRHYPDLGRWLRAASTAGVRPGQRSL